jgi:hypothetical protein
MSPVADKRTRHALLQLQPFNTNNGSRIRKLVCVPAWFRAATEARALPYKVSPAAGVLKRNAFVPTMDTKKSFTENGRVVVRSLWYAAAT